MREAIGSSLLLYIVIFFIGVVMLFFISMLSYSKAYRVKNRIINIVEEYDFANFDTDEVVRRKLFEEINSDLISIGYSSSNNKDCTSDSSYGNACVDLNVPANGGGVHDFCICKINASNGYYFEVITYTQFKFPVIENVIASAVHGESKILGIEYDY